MEGVEIQTGMESQGAFWQRCYRDKRRCHMAVLPQDYYAIFNCAPPPRSSQNPSAISVSHLQLSYTLLPVLGLNECVSNHMRKLGNSSMHLLQHLYLAVTEFTQHTQAVQWQHAFIATPLMTGQRIHSANVNSPKAAGICSGAYHNRLQISLSTHRQGSSSMHLLRHLY